MFSSITMNHMRAIKAWADANKGQAQLDMSSFELEIKARNRYYRLYPQFMLEQDGRLSHVTALSPNTSGFLGWRPYQPISSALAVDKLRFKDALRGAGLPTPRWWSSAAEAETDFVLKRSIGSFGYQLAGPFKKGQEVVVPASLTNATARGTLYAESFIRGQIIKAWFWGERPVHVQSQNYPHISGDGQQSVKSLITRRLAEGGIEPSRFKEVDAVLSCLAYQDVTPDDVLAEGRQVWIDYRYGRRFSTTTTTEAQDNVLPRLAALQREQIAKAGHWLAETLKSERKAPMLFAMDAVLDDAGTFWWLEANSNPTCPPTAYFAMLASLFGTPPTTPPNAFASTRPAPPNRPAVRLVPVAPQPPNA